MEANGFAAVPGFLSSPFEATKNAFANPAGISVVAVLSQPAMKKMDAHSPALAANKDFVEFMVFLRVTACPPRCNWG
jgi:hypothetical protein